MLAPFGSLLQVQAHSLSWGNKRIQAEKSGPASAIAPYYEMVGGG